MSTSGLVKFLMACRGGWLTRVDLSGVPAVTDSLLDVLASACGHRLERLAINGCRNVTDGGLVHVARYLAFLCPPRGVEGGCSNPTDNHLIK